MLITQLPAEFKLTATTSVNKTGNNPVYAVKGVRGCARLPTPCWDFNLKDAADSGVQVQGSPEHREQREAVAAVILGVVLLIKLMNIIHTYFMG